MLINHQMLLIYIVMNIQLLNKLFIIGRLLYKLNIVNKLEYFL